MHSEEYHRKLLSAADAVETIRDGDSVLLPGGAITPVEFGNHLPQLIGRRREIRLMTYLPLAPLKIYQAPDAGETFTMESPFYNRILQGPAGRDCCSFIPNHLRNISRDWHAAVPEIDLMVVTVSPADRHGWFTMAGSAILEWDLLPYTKRVIVEVASHAPRTFGDTLIHISQVDGIIEADRYPATLPRERPTAEDELLGGHVADLVEDESTIQLGFGGTIDALAGQLKGKRGLGIHTESFSDCAMELLECGAADNAHKTLHRGLTITSFTMGSEKLYDYIDDNPAILHKSLSYTNNLSVIAQNRKMVSINAALHVDLSGQCASEAVGTHQISGSGGQVDTGVGAQMAGGRSIITLKSTRTRRDPATGQSVRESCIRPMLPEGSCVTYTRSNVHFVATEYGAVCLRGLTVKERARKLISIAHPDYRDWLREEFERVYQMKL